MAVRRIGICYLLLLVSISLIEAVTEATNLDIIFPLVKTSPGDTSKDRFGYSVALHHIAKPEEGNFDSFLSNAR